VTSRPNGNGRWTTLWTLLRYEMRMVFRDTRTVMIAIIAPIVIFPIIIFVSRQVEESEEERLRAATYRYVVVGDSARWAEGIVNAALALEASEEDTVPEDSFVQAAPPAASSLGQGWTDSLLAALDVELVVRGLSPDRYDSLRMVRRDSARDEADEADEADGAEEADEAERDEREADGAEGDDLPDFDRAAVPVIVLEYRGTSDFSRRASDRLRTRLVELRDQRRDSALLARALPVLPDDFATVEEVNVASPEKEGGAMLGLALTPLLLLLMLSGGSIVAADAISGEKERGTLETLLTTAARRPDIVHSKLLTIVGFGLVVGVVNVLNLLFYVVLGVVELPPTFAVDLSVLDLTIVLVLIVPLTLLVAAALLLPSGYAKSYREYQIYFLPVFLAVLVPSLATLLPGIELRSAVAFVPIAGIGVAIQEVMVGQRDWLFLPIAFLSTGGAAWGLARLAEATLSTERLITGGGRDESDIRGGAALFGRQVLGWFAGLWALFFTTNLWFGDDLGLRGQVVVNLGVIFLGGSIVMIRRYGLPLRDTLSLRSPHPAAWLATLVGAPSALAVAMGLSQLVNAYVFPVPEQMLEAFGDVMLGQEIPFWQLLLFVAVAPGILEEIAFRGVLFAGLRRWMKPLPMVLLGGLIFGLFHVSLFRIIPTAYLGVVLGAVVVLTGSIYPAMLWHFLNNAVAVTSAELGWLDASGTLPAWAYGAGAAGLALSFWILWSTRDARGKDPPGRRGDRREAKAEATRLTPRRP